ncbi:Autophagy-related protein [Wickerhamomyces ciferrii]|uniref:Autophagy-related protein 13 n=1 Tax=Wickerhamomyces ciferrii (strain ATCC 14091 / BCRC 22168 / CBS 111 / JCM 3599 / NBRC 0793 / NRRL Y-1031 F-60-10) TaxID=1206466 RepID=K0KQU7_WICCF|nr:Autophagy-related protein [Wickerhamomyces ciferrii]CCH45471.1 Autophagy-related protein [Wickerhamomyces ciferrii]
MSSNKRDKLSQVIQNFFLKAANVITQARSPMELDNINTVGSSKLNKWFNLDIYDGSREEIKQWKALNGKSTPPIVIETYLDLRDLNLNQSLILKDDEDNTWNINTKKNEIVLERWLIEMDRSVADDENVELPLLYKKLIVTFRYLYTISKLLPTYKLLKRLLKIKLTKTPLKVSTRILDGNRPIVSKGRVGLSKPIINNIEDHLVQKTITPISTTVGTLKISVSYRKHTDFQLIDNEETLSNHFLNIDKTTKSTSAPIKRAFKTGTVSPPSTSPLGRNNSNASLVQALRTQRTGSNASPSATGTSFPKSITSSVGSVYGIPVPNSNDLSSSASGSTPKYSSSFGRITRRSSIRRSSSVERGTPSSIDRTPSVLRNPSTSGGVTATGTVPDDDINDFVKLLDNKPDLRLKYSPNIYDSLGKFQSMKTKNEILSDSMTASVFSKSTSPPPLPPNSYNTGRNVSISPKSTSNYLPAIPSRLLENNSSQDSLGLREVRSNSTNISRIGSSSPGSILRGRSNKSFSIGPSNPTIAATATHAKMHKISSNSVDSITGVVKKAASGEGTTTSKDNTENNDEDDDLLFTMSDMNLPK